MSILHISKTSSVKMGHTFSEGDCFKDRYRLEKGGIHYYCVEHSQILHISKNRGDLINSLDRDAMLILSDKYEMITQAEFNKALTDACIALGITSRYGKTN